MPFIQVSDHRLFYESPHYLGSVDHQRRGAAILFLHGVFGNYRLFEEQLKFFAAAHTPIALGLPGHGRSSGEGFGEIAAYTDVVKAFVDALRLAPVALCGHCLGGAVATDYALRYPEDLEGLVLLSTGINFPEAQETAGEMETDPEGYRGQQGVWGLSKHARSEVADRLMRARAETPVQAAVRGLKAMARWDPSRWLRTVGVPTTILFGEEDPRLSQAHALLEAIPHAFFDTIPLSGHYPHVEMPDVLNDNLNRFLTAAPDLASLAGD